MIKTLTLDGLTSVTIKQSAYDMARFCWLYNHSDSDIYASCVNAECTENADNVLRVPAGEPRMLDTECHETLYLNGSGTVEIITSAYAVCPFKRTAKGGDTVVQPLVLFEGTDAGYSLADGFTGFTPYYTDTPAGANADISQAIDAKTESRYGIILSKTGSNISSAANYTDSCVISSNEKIDLTNYNTICIDFYGHCNFEMSNMLFTQRMEAYLKIDRPEILPQSKTAYDWAEWDRMCMNYHRDGKYYFDISKLTGEHYLCFGIWHGSYGTGNDDNGIKMYKMKLM